jgi:hypothetical protein
MGRCTGEARPACGVRTDARQQRNGVKCKGKVLGGMRVHLDTDTPSPLLFPPRRGIRTARRHASPEDTRGSAKKIYGMGAVSEPLRWPYHRLVTVNDVRMPQYLRFCVDKQSFAHYISSIGQYGKRKAS